MNYEIICAGFGGQGVLTAGMVLAGIGSLLGRKVTWYPSYGAEMRGGTANCNVKINETKPVASPYATKPNVLFTMNEPAIDKFEKILRPDGYLFVNEALVDADRKYRDDINVIKVDATGIADRINNPKGANIVMLGAMIKATAMFTYEDAEQMMCEYFEDHGKGKFNESNKTALKAGYDEV